MVRVALFSVAILTAAPSLAAQGPHESALGAAELVAGEALGFDGGGFAAPIGAEAFALDADMHTFVAPLKGIRDPHSRLVALLKSMEARGLFSLEYAEITRSVSATFHERQGNCLSFTMLLVALARAAGLPAAYQTVEVPPTWSNDGQVVIANHINAVVRTARGEETVVDFNIRDYDGKQPTRRVSDDYALGLFYTNLGAEALLRDQRAASFAYLREAARVYPDMAGVWVNLGVLYAREHRYAHAEAAYLQALEADANEPSALANLVLVYEALGEPELAESYRKRVQGYRDRNPYYHFAVATKAYDEARLPEALTAVRKALRLKHDEYEFHALLGRVLAGLGRAHQAEQSAARAQALAVEKAARDRALVRLDTLALR